MGPGLMLAVGAGLLYLLTRGEKKKEGAPPSVTKNSCIDEHMPDSVAKDVMEMLTTVTDPAVLAAAAQQAAKNAFPKAATCLQMMAEEWLKKGKTGTEDEIPPWVTTPPVEPPTHIPGSIPGMVPPGKGVGDKPHTIRYGDIPYHMAEYYTGQGGRFRELEPINPHLGSLTKDAQGVSNYPGWQPGVTILLPATWKPWDKPVPAPLGGSGTTAPPEPVIPTDLPEIIQTYYPWYKPGDKEIEV